jgi:hypothetical protein
VRIFPSWEERKESINKPASSFEMGVMEEEGMR